MKTKQEIEKMLYSSQRKLRAVELKLENCKCMTDSEYYVGHKMQLLVEIKVLTEVLS